MLFATVQATVGLASHGGVLPVDLAANAASLGVRVWRAQGIAEFRDALREARIAAIAAARGAGPKS